MREILDVAELSRRMAEMPPRLLIVPGMPDTRIICERATEETFGEQMRRMTVYAMSYATCRRATNEVRNKWGVQSEMEEHHVGQIFGRSVRIPLRFNDGLREWEIEL